MTLTNTNDQNHLLVVEDVHAAYVKKEILHGVSLSVNRGEIVALLGGNGSGKSTLLKTIAGVLTQNEGRVLLNGEDISSSSVHVRHEMGVGYLIQGGRVFANLSVAENFAIAKAHARKTNATDSTELGDIFPTLVNRAGDRAGLLSGGQRQMLAIEMVLAQNPILVLLDEPSAGLTTALVQEVLGKIAGVAKNHQLAVLLVEQNVEEAKRIATRQLRLESGIVKPQSVEELQTG